MSIKRVVIVGAGIGGLSAAHELINLQKNGNVTFAIDLFEASDAVGGKARSQYPQSAAYGPLPAEHGFRFCPHFYRHFTDTLKTIPVPAGSYDHAENVKTVFARLKTSDKAGLADKGTLYPIDRPLPDNVDEWWKALRDTFIPMGFKLTDLSLYALRFGTFATASDARREQELENESWNDFMHASKYTSDFRQLIVNGSVNLSAMKATEGSALTIGTISMQMYFPFGGGESGPADAPLDCPTDEALLAPWQAHLVASGATITFGKQLTGLGFTGAYISELRFADGTTETLADPKETAVVFGIPLERMQALLEADPDFRKRAQSLANIELLGKTTRDMVGVQFYFKKKLDLGTFDKGHITFPRSPYALTAVPQMRFWHPERVKALQLKGIHEVLSVIVSNWRDPYDGVTAAAQPDKTKLGEAVWKQLADGLGPALDINELVYTHVDDNITLGNGKVVNTTPLLVHEVGKRYLRPPAAIGLVRNMFIAADYVKTETDLASMESANEAARVVVQEIGKALDVPQSAWPRLWQYKEDGLVGSFFTVWKEVDETLYGMRWRHVMDGGTPDEWVSVVKREIVKLGVNPALVLAPEALGVQPNVTPALFPKRLFKPNADVLLASHFGGLAHTRRVMRVLEAAFQARPFGPQQRARYWVETLSRPLPPMPI